jgi:hypothetical protein
VDEKQAGGKTFPPAGPWPYMTGSFRQRFAALESSLKELPAQIAVKPEAILVVSAPLVNRIRTAIGSMMVEVLREVPEEERASMLRNLQQIRWNLSSGCAADLREPAHRVSSMGSPRESSRGQLATVPSQQAPAAHPTSRY